jgi:hypothetical protein
MTPRCFLLATGATGVRWVGGVIFSNVKAGMACPLFVELKHSQGLPNILSRILGPKGPQPAKSFIRLMRTYIFKHGLCQIVAKSRCIADRAIEL